MKKNILVIGGGGREHAICHKLKESKNVEKIYAAPGNVGIAQIAECIDIKATDIDGIVDFVKSKGDIYMTVVAPDDPLSLGLVDRLTEIGHRAFGPNAAAAQIESSKVFAKNLMKEYGIPTAEFEVFDDYQKAVEYLSGVEYPIVIKADGLALGKGVIICPDEQQAENALKEIMLDKKFGESGSRVVIEEFLIGYEASAFVFTDGKSISIMPTSRDYKRAYDGDRGLNTGGMGAFCPFPTFEPLLPRAEQEIFIPTIKALAREGRPFKGVLYFGLMVCGEKIKVLEYNARFGDPETQVILPGLKTDLLKIFDAIIDGRLHKINIEWDGKKRVCVIAASGGYPMEYQKGKEIEIPDDLDKDILVFYAGAAKKGEKLVTSGGRVLGVTAASDSLEEARQKVYQNIEKISFDGMFYRSDICKNQGVDK